MESEDLGHLLGLRMEREGTVQKMHWVAENEKQQREEEVFLQKSVDT